MGAKEIVNATIKSGKVVVFSKTYCPYCTMAKDALKKAGCTDYVLMELENREDCSDLQDELLKITGARTVPRVFINGKCIGGGSETEALGNSGELQKMIAA